MEWQILIVGGITLITFLTIIIKPILSFNKNIIDLNWSIKTLTENIIDLKDTNKEDHNKIYSTLDNHEGRITNIEVNYKYSGDK